MEQFVRFSAANDRMTLSVCQFCSILVAASPTLGCLRIAEDAHICQISGRRVHTKTVHEPDQERRFERECSD